MIAMLNVRISLFILPSFLWAACLVSSALTILADSTPVAEFRNPFSIEKALVNQSEQKENSPRTGKILPITVFVHGIKSIKPHVSLDNFFRFMSDDIHGTIYEKTVELMRRDPFFYKNQPMQGIGLHKIDLLPVTQGDASRAMATLLQEINARIGNPTNTEYFTYGWTGVLSATTRYNESVRFFQTLEDMTQSYIDKGFEPELTLFGYSHGGNVCLNLARASVEKFPESKLKIKQLILVGSPVQGETDYLVNSPIFEEIYHFYSNSDRVQPLDFFSYDRFFSGRTFTERKDFKLPEKFTQIQLKVMRDSSRVKGSDKKKKLASNLENPVVLNGNSHLVRDASPGHSELWFFGWTPISYRKEYPLYPLPTIGLAPIIINEIKNIKHKLKDRSVIADIRPEHNLLLLRGHNSIKPHSTSSLFPGGSTIKQLESLVIPFAPENYTAQIYNSHIRLAYEHARIYYAKRHEKKNPMAAKNQEQLRQHKEKIRRRLKQRKNKGMRINVSLHRKLACPFCNQTNQVLVLARHIDNQMASNSSIESSCARSLSTLCDIAWRL